MHNTPHSKETKAKISAVLSDGRFAKEKNPNWGKMASAETRAKQSKAHMGFKMTAESRAKCSIAKAGKNSPMWGRKMSAETKAKIAAARKGTEATKETRAKMSAAHTGRVYQKGRKLSNETRARMSASKKGKVSSINTIIATSKRMETKAERLLHKALVEQGIAFVPHFPVLDRYVCDIYLPKMNIVLEADGWSHTSKCYFYNPQKEKQRDSEIAATGLKIIRIPDTIITKNPHEAIRQALGEALL